MKTLYISDLDGTLLTPKKKISPQTAEIINNLIDQGMLFTVATARSSSAMEILSELHLNLTGALLNGVLLYDFAQKEYVGCVPISHSAACEVMELLRRFDRLGFVYTMEDKEICVAFERLYNDYEQKFYQERKGSAYKRFDQVDHISIGEKDRVIYFTMIDEQQRLQPIFEELLQMEGVHPVLYRDNYSDLFFLEIFSSQASKSYGVKELKKKYEAQRVVAFGDNRNDIDMLLSADIGLVVEDGAAEAKEVADGLVASSTEDGVARYLLHNWKNS